MRRRLLMLAKDPLALDVAIVSALAVASSIVGWPVFAHPAFLKSAKFLSLYRPGWWQAPIWWWAAAVELGALLVRRRFPVVAFAAVAAAALFHGHTGWPLLPADAAALVALYSVAAYSRRLVAVAVLVVALTLLDLRSAIPFTFYGWHGGVILFGLALLAAWFSGAYVGQMRQRARSLERQRDEQAELAVRAERERITRELHDVVAHGLSVIVVQAQGASAALTPKPDEARQALDAIVSTGRQSLAEMRRLLGITRSEDTPAVPLTPQPGLARLPDLIEQVRGAGLPVELAVDGSARDLSPGVDLSAYRIVQEGLTNTLKHGGREATASVRLRYLPRALEIEVRNTGASSPSASDGRGQGIEGMRERADMLGGTLHAGPLEAGGFRIFVELPSEAAAE